MSSLYVYAIVDADAALPEEPDVPSLHLLDCGGVRAAVGAVEGPPPVEAEALRAHDATVCRLAQALPAVLPARFGAVVGSAAELREMLAPRGDSLRAALDHVRGREQMTLRLSATGETALDPPPAAPSQGPGTDYLASRAGARLRRIPAVARVLEGLRAFARDERLEPAGRPPLLGTVYHLIDRGAGPGYLERVEGLRGDAGGLRLAASGPWPPYAFAEAGW